MSSWFAVAEPPNTKQPVQPASWNHPVQYYDRALQGRQLSSDSPVEWGSDHITRDPSVAPVMVMSLDDMDVAHVERDLQQSANTDIANQRFDESSVRPAVYTCPYCLERVRTSSSFAGKLASEVHSFSIGVLAATIVGLMLALGKRLSKRFRNAIQGLRNLLSRFRRGASAESSDAIEKTEQAVQDFEASPSKERHLRVMQAFVEVGCERDNDIAE